MLFINDHLYISQKYIYVRLLLLLVSGVNAASDSERGVITLIAKRAKSKNRMQIIKSPSESDNISVFWENLDENELQILV